MEFATDRVLTDSKKAIFQFRHANGFTDPTLRIQLELDKIEVRQDCSGEPMFPRAIEEIGTWKIKKNPADVTVWFNGELFSHYTFMDSVSNSLDF